MMRIYTGFFQMPTVSEDTEPTTIYGPFDTADLAKQTIDGAAPMHIVVQGVFIIAETVHVEDNTEGYGAGFTTDNDESVDLATESQVPTGWDSIEGDDESVDTLRATTVQGGGQDEYPANITATGAVQLPKDKRWDARSTYMAGVIYDLRACCKHEIGEEHTMLTDQDLLDIYGDAYLMDDTKQQFIIMAAETIDERKRAANV